jgi:hypothetical protein
VDYNLTDQQKAVARFLVEKFRQGVLPETFNVAGLTDGRIAIFELKAGLKTTTGGVSFVPVNATLGDLDALAESKMLIARSSYYKERETQRTCTLTGLIYRAVDTNFVDEGSLASAAANLQPRYVPNTAFIMMWMAKGKPELDDVCNTIKGVCSDFGIQAVRADDIEHQDKITDVVLQRIRESEFLIADVTGERPNVYYEIGYAHASGKRPILYRREGTALHFDLSVHNAPEYRNLTHLKELLTRRFEALLGHPAPAKKATQTVPS